MPLNLFIIFKTALKSLSRTFISSRDFPLIQGLVLYLSVIVVACNFFVDIFYSIIDPRIRLRGSH